MNCILCNKEQGWDICYDCQADGDCHPLPKEAFKELQRRRKLGIDYESRLANVKREIKASIHPIDHWCMTTPDGNCITEGPCMHTPGVFL